MEYKLDAVIINGDTYVPEEKLKELQAELNRLKTAFLLLDVQTTYQKKRNTAEDNFNRMHGFY